MEPGVSDEFLRRECHLDIAYVSRVPVFENNHASVVIMSDAQFDAWLPILQGLTKNSVIVILLGSETVNLKVTKQLVNLECVGSIYMQYRPNYNLIACMITIYCFFRDWKRRIFSKDFWKILNRGLRRFTKTIYFSRLAKSKKIFYLPLGYTTNFSAGFLNYLEIHHQHSSDSSLFDLFVDEPIERSIPISFRGQKNGPFRRFFIDHREELPQEIQINVKQHWGGSQSDLDEKYIDELIKSRFVLALPGHVSNETFRYVEALICGSLPIISTTSALDWSKTNSPFEKCDGTLKYSLKKILELIPEISEHVRKQMIANEILKMKELTSGVRISLQASINELEKI